MSRDLAKEIVALLEGHSDDERRAVIAAIHASMLTPRNYEPGELDARFKEARARKESATTDERVAQLEEALFKLGDDE